MKTTAFAPHVAKPAAAQLAIVMSLGLLLAIPGMGLVFPASAQTSPGQAPSAPPGAGDATALIAAGDVYFNDGLYDRALAKFLEASKVDPANLVARLRLAKVYAELGDRAAGLEALGAIYAAKPELKDNDELKALKARLEALPATKPTRSGGAATTQPAAVAVAIPPMQTKKDRDAIDAVRTVYGSGRSSAPIDRLAARELDNLYKAAAALEIGRPDTREPFDKFMTKSAEWIAANPGDTGAIAARAALALAWYKPREAWEAGRLLTLNDAAANGGDTVLDVMVRLREAGLDTWSWSTGEWAWRRWMGRQLLPSAKDSDKNVKWLVEAWAKAGSVEGVAKALKQVDKEFATTTTGLRGQIVTELARAGRSTEAIGLIESVGDAKERAGLLQDVRAGSAEHARNNGDLKLARERAREIESPVSRHKLLLEIALEHRLAGDADLARIALDEDLSLVRSTSLKDDPAIWSALGKEMSDAGHNEAAATLQQAIEIASAKASPEDCVKALRTAAEASKGNIALRDGALKKALEVAGNIASATLRADLMSDIGGDMARFGMPGAADVVRQAEAAMELAGSENGLDERGAMRRGLLRSGLISSYIALGDFVSAFRIAQVPELAFRADYITRIAQDAVKKDRDLVIQCFDQLEAAWGTVNDPEFAEEKVNNLLRIAVWRHKLQAGSSKSALVAARSTAEAIPIADKELFLSLAAKWQRLTDVAAVAYRIGDRAECDRLVATGLEGPTSDKRGGPLVDRTPTMWIAARRGDATEVARVLDRWTNEYDREESRSFEFHVNRLLKPTEAARELAQFKADRGIRELEIAVKAGVEIVDGAAEGGHRELAWMAWTSMLARAGKLPEDSIARPRRYQLAGLLRSIAKAGVRHDDLALAVLALRSSPEPWSAWDIQSLGLDPESGGLAASIRFSSFMYGDSNAWKDNW